jgi:hypothetical protein
MGQRVLRSGVGEDMSEALSAYALKQATLLQHLGKAFASLWYPALVGHGIDPEWPNHYNLDPSDVEALQVPVPEEDDVHGADLDDIF